MYQVQPKEDSVQATTLESKFSFFLSRICFKSHPDSYENDAVLLILATLVPRRE